MVRKTNTATTTIVRETEKNVLKNFNEEYLLVMRRYMNQINNLIHKCQDNVQKSDAAHLFIFKHTGLTTDIEAEKVIGIFNEVINATVSDDDNDKENEQKEEKEHNITENWSLLCAYCFIEKCICCAFQSCTFIIFLLKFILYL